ncbi:MAG: TIM barrel protein [Candidatus Latescibacteria bacterium]|nr:TIM barrel protein [Candidatus Latescibacterota bacterium]
MIKLSVFSDDLAADWDQALQAAQKANVQGVDIRNVWGKSSKDLTDAEAKKMAQTLKATDLKAVCLGSTYGRQFWLDDPESRKMTEETLAKMIRFCDILNTDKIRIFVLWIRGYEEDKKKWAIRPRYNLDLLNRLVQNLEPSVKMAEQAGVKLLIENEGNSYSGTCREARLIMECIDSPAVQCLYHPRKTHQTGERAYPEGYNQIRDYIQHVHMGRLDYCWDNTEPEVPHREALEGLVADGYDKWITIERHFHPLNPGKEPELQAQTLRDIEAVRQMLTEIQQHIGQEA